jgi:hypothetical protein
MLAKWREAFGARREEENSMEMTMNSTATAPLRNPGLRVSELEVGEEIEVHTSTRIYHLVHLGAGEAWIWGHPEFCPKPIRVKIHGSTWGGSSLFQDFIGIGMRLEFEHPTHSTVTTSPIATIVLPSSATSGRVV